MPAPTTPCHHPHRRRQQHCCHSCVWHDGGPAAVSHTLIAPQRLAADTTVSLSIDRCPPGFRLQAHHVDWTDKFRGSAGALQIALESRTATLPLGAPGVYIRSTRFARLRAINRHVARCRCTIHTNMRRLSDLQGEDVYFFVCQKSAAGCVHTVSSERPPVTRQSTSALRLLTMVQPCVSPTPDRPAGVLFSKNPRVSCARIRPPEKMSEAR